MKRAPLSRQRRPFSALDDISDVFLHGERVEVETFVDDAHRNNCFSGRQAAVSCVDTGKTGQGEGLSQSGRSYGDGFAS